MNLEKEIKELSNDIILKLGALNEKISNYNIDNQNLEANMAFLEKNRIKLYRSSFTTIRKIDNITKEIDRKIFNSCDHKWVPEIGQICHGASERNYYCLKCNRPQNQY